MASILVIRHGALGDIAQTFGPLQAIRRHHASDRLVFLTSSPFVGLLQRCPWIDEIWIDDRPPITQLAAWLALRRRMRGARFDRVYDLQLHARTNWYFQMLLPEPRPEWCGVARGASHRHVNPRRNELHNEDRAAEQLALVGIHDVPPPDLLWLDSDVSRLSLPDRFALLVPGASVHRAIKKWPAENFAQLANFIAARGLAPVVVGAAAEAELARQISAAEPSTIDLMGQTSIAELAALGRRAAVSIGNDTGPMHLIAETRSPTLMLMSRESDPAHCAPRGPKARFLRRAFIKDLPAEEVEAAVAELLA